MTAELTNEQIVTNLLISDEILKPISNVSRSNYNRSLGKYLSDEIKKQKELKKQSRYKFLDLDSGWDF